MKTVDNRRQLADLCRRVANIPTEGGHRADQTLCKLAEELEFEEELGSETAPPAGDDNAGRRPAKAR